MTSELYNLGGQSFPVFGDISVDQGAFLFGIPFNRSKYDPVLGGADPLMTITQEERFWRQVNTVDASLHRAPILSFKPLVLVAMSKHTTSQET